MSAPGADDFTAGTDAQGNGMPPMPFEPEPDQVAGPTSDRMLGVVIDYTYSGGRHYKLTFDHEHHVTFSMPDRTPPIGPDGKPMGAPSLNYRAREIREDIILVHWIVKEASIHVSITIDLTENKLYSACMMPPNRWEFFDVATIESVTST